jgi:hypothetical protein
MGPDCKMIRTHVWLETGVPFDANHLVFNEARVTGPFEEAFPYRRKG